MPFPGFGVTWVNPGEVLYVGGGGKSKSGVKNAIAVQRVEVSPCQIPRHHHPSWHGGSAAEALGLGSGSGSWGGRAGFESGLRFLLPEGLVLVGHIADRGCS